MLIRYCWFQINYLNIRAFKILETYISFPYWSKRSILNAGYFLIKKILKKTINRLNAKIHNSGHPHISEDRAVFLYFKRVKFTLIFSLEIPYVLWKCTLLKCLAVKYFYRSNVTFCMHLFTHNQLIFGLQSPVYCLLNIFHIHFHLYHCHCLR